MWEGRRECYYRFLLSIPINSLATELWRWVTTEFKEREEGLNEVLIAGQRLVHATSLACIYKEQLTRRSRGGSMTVVADFSLLPFYVSQVLAYIGWAGAGYLAWRVVRAYERHAFRRTRSRILGRRIRRLEAAMGRVKRRVASTADAQQFTTALLLGRPNAGSRNDEAGRTNSDQPVT